jgi:hypothetical protein
LSRAAPTCCAIWSEKTGVFTENAEPELVTISRKKCAEEERYDILIAADEPQIENAAHDLMQHGTDVRAIQADLAGAR